MRKLLVPFLLLGLIYQIKAQQITPIIKLTDFSSRALDVHNDKILFGANRARFGFYDINTKTHQLFTIKDISNQMEFRAVSASSTGYFILSAGSPALLYKVEPNGSYQEVYRDEDPKVFYDSMKQIDSNNYIAIGDQIDGCMSVLRSKDAGRSWQRIPCNKLPKFQPLEGAFAASNTNIVVKNGMIWFGTGVKSSRVFTSKDLGKSWTISQTKMANKAKTQGIYSLDFYDERIGIAWGGDYTKPKTIFPVASLTQDGGKSWQVLSSANVIGYRSAVQFVPNTDGNEIVVVGFNGVGYSKDKGKTWKSISEDSYYALKFINSHQAYLIGKEGMGLLDLDK